MPRHFQIKRVYDTALVDDGYRVLVDRLWSRGVRKEMALLDEWDKNIAPSPQLRKWFGHKEARFNEFSQHYAEELRLQEEELKRLREIAANQR